MKKSSPEYSVKKQSDGDYEVTLHNQTKIFSLKEVMMSFLEAQKSFKEAQSQLRLDKAVFQNVQDHHSDVIKMFSKLPKVKRAALVNYIEISTMITKDEIRFKDAKKRHDRFKKELAAIHAVIPAEDKKLTKSEARRIAASR